MRILLALNLALAGAVVLLGAWKARRIWQKPVGEARPAWSPITPELRAAEREYLAEVHGDGGRVPEGMGVDFHAAEVRRG